MTRRVVESLCVALAEGLVSAVDITVAPELVASWLSGHLPSRQYDRPYVPPPRLPFPSQERTQLVRSEPVPRSGGGVKREADGRERMTVQVFDVVRHITSGASTTSENRRSDGTVVSVTTDAGGDTAQRLHENCYAAAPLATSLLTTHIFGQHEPRNELIDSLARLFVIVLFEPVRLCIDIQFTRPVTSDVELALRSATCDEAATPAGRLESDTLLQSSLASFTVNWFEGVVELAAQSRALRADTLTACRTAFEHWRELFDVTQCAVDEMQARLSGFRYNAHVARRLDRGALLGAFCRTFVVSRGAANAGFTREVCLAAIDRANVRALTIAATPAGGRFASAAAVTLACTTARRLLRAQRLDDVAAEAAQATPTELIAAIVAAVRAKY
jgi:hypothetical protein